MNSVLLLPLVLSKPRDAQERAMRNLIQTAATIRNVFANGNDAIVGRAGDKRYGTRSYLDSVSHSSPAHVLTRAGAECRRGLVRWLKTVARLPLLGMAMRQPVAPCFVGRRAVS
jgi:hypothetical protein